MTLPDQDARLSLAGFPWSLASFIPSVLASLNYIAQLVLIFLGRSGEQPGLSISEVLLLLLAAFPMAVVGLILCVRGRHSRSRRRLAITGMTLSITALAPFFVALVVLSLTLAYCSTHLCL